MTLYACAHAQVLILILGSKFNTEKLTFGIHLQYGRSNLTNLEDSKTIGKFNFGILFNYRLSQRFALQTELMPGMTLGARNLKPYSLNDPALDAQFENGDIDRKITYMGLPVLAQYQVLDYVWIEFGPQVYLRRKAFDTFMADPTAGELSLKHKIKDQTADWEAGVSAGLSYQMFKGNDIWLGLRYYWGLTDVMTNTPEKEQFRAWQITAGIPVGRQKKLEQLRAAKEQQTH